MLPLLWSLALACFASTSFGQDAPQDPSPDDAEVPSDPPKSEVKKPPAETSAEDEAGSDASEESEDEEAAAASDEADGEAAEKEEADSADAKKEEPVEIEEPAGSEVESEEEAESEESGDAEAVVEEEGLAEPSEGTDAAADEAPEEELPPKPSIPGSPRPVGLGLAPEAPPAPPAPGGRAPSFGTPLDAEDASLTISGNFAAWQMSGIGRRPLDAGDGYGTPIHSPPLVAGRIPFWRQAELSLFITYGTPVVNATVGFFAFAGGREYQGFRQASQGPTFSQAYLTFSPNPIGNLRVRAVAGAFTETYAGPGQWGWGIFGPLIGVRGYGETTHLEYMASSKLRLTAAAGFAAVPGIPEDFTRGQWTGWTETGVSTFVHHGHAGFNYGGKYNFKLHYASAMGTDERVYLVDDPRDGRMDVYAAEGHWYGVPWGHVGVSGGIWDFNDALSVHDAIWWGIKWSKGSQDMIRDYIGNAEHGNGTVAAVSAEYNMSLARIAWHPRPFDGRAPDVRVSVAGVAHRTLNSDDPAFEDASGYLFGTEIEYQMLRWLSFNVRAYGENRSWYGDRWGAYNIAPGFAFRSDWQSPDRIELWYSRHFYSDVVDNNPAQPLDRDMVALGVFLGF